MAPVAVMGGAADICTKQRESGLCRQQGTRLQLALTLRGTRHSLPDTWFVALKRS